MNNTAIVRLSFCIAAVLAILVRPWCIALPNAVNLPAGHHSFNAIQRVVKKNESHEDALEVNETTLPGQFKVIRPRIVPPYQFLAVDFNAALPGNTQSHTIQAISPTNRYFQLTSLLRI